MRFAWLAVLALGCGSDVVAGPQGPIGQQGLRGEKGDKGDPGEAAGGAYKPSSWVSCIAVLDLLGESNGMLARGPDGTTETELHYTVLSYSNHDVEVTCDAAAGSNHSSAFSQYYPAVAKGASSALCSADLDYPPTPAGGGTAGMWNFAIDVHGPNALYVDPDNPLGLNGFIHVFTDNDCDSNRLDDEGDWTQVKLTDVAW